MALGFALMALLVAPVAAAGAADSVPPRYAGATTSTSIIGDPSASYSLLKEGPAWKRQIREDLGKAQSKRRARRRSLLYFAQMTDYQLADDESPARVEFLDLDSTPFTAAWRPQEALGPYVIDAAIRRINDFDRSQIDWRRRTSKGKKRKAQRRLSFTVLTGDNADNQQLNEARWVRTLLEGGALDPNSGVESSSPCAAGTVKPGEAKRYTGVQDYTDYYEEPGFWDPNKPVGRWSGWPAYPGLMDRAQQPFTAVGLKRPSYIVQGNHDAQVQGNQAASSPIEAIATGCSKVFRKLDLTALGPGALANPQGVAAVPPDPERRFVDKAEYRQLFQSGKQADGHGFGFVDPKELSASDGKASYYAFDAKPGVRLVAMDTNCEGGVAGPSANGNIDDPQFKWIERELEAATARKQLILLTGHHPIRTLDCAVPDEAAPKCQVPPGQHDPNPGCDRDPRSSDPLHNGDDLKALLLKNRNVIAYVAGHTHEHRITPFKRSDGSGGFWGIETASEVDWPIESRLLEIMDNRDGTLSIFGTVIDFGGEIRAPASGTAGGGLNDSTLATVARTLSYNDPQGGLKGGGEGKLGDRNVELLLPDPR